jgi:hypothetical protein
MIVEASGQEGHLSLTQCVAAKLSDFACDLGVALCVWVYGHTVEHWIACGNLRTRWHLQAEETQ